jgi:uncharacterized protein YjiK
MTQLNTRATIDTLRSRDSATFNNTYQTLGSAVTHSMRLIKITNNSTVLVTISIDGLNDNEVLPAGSFVLIDFSANRETGNAFELPANTQFYVKGAAGTGSVYLSVYYAN